jgi:hypothetical protein
VVRLADFAIKSGKEGQTLKGIGPSLGAVIQTYIDNGGGGPGAGGDEKEARDAAVEELVKVFGVCRSDAKKLADKGYLGPANLLGAEGEKVLDEAQQLGLRFLRDLEKVVHDAEVRHEAAVLSV